LSDRKSSGHQPVNNCQTKNRGRGRPRLPGTSERLTFRVRRGTEHDEILAVLDSLPERAKSAWVVHALMCYVRGEIRDVQRETEKLSEELQLDLFSMFSDEE
jgi:hypothetical protein